ARRGTGLLIFRTAPPMRFSAKYHFAHWPKSRPNAISVDKVRLAIVSRVASIPRNTYSIRACVALNLIVNACAAGCGVTDLSLSYSSADRERVRLAGAIEQTPRSL